MINYPAFVDNDHFISMDDTVSENDQLKAMLSNLTRVHLLAANKFENFDALIREYIRSGIEIFGLETGIVSRIKGETYTICDVVSPFDVLSKGQEFELQDTYCREVLKINQALGIPEVGKLKELNCHPVYVNLKLESYLSAPIYVGDELFGTLNFTSIDIREHGFSEHEHTLIRLMADSVGNFILLREKENKLIALNERIRRFVGYVAHDLRNPIATIIGLAKMGKRPNVTQERLDSIIDRVLNLGEHSLEFVNTILENAALNAGKIQLNNQNENVANLINEVVDSVSLMAQENHNPIEVQICGDIQINCDKIRIEQCCSNLLINAVKYSPPYTTIFIRCSDIENQCCIEIENTIDQENLVETSASDAYRSIGFGLDIVNDILQAHKSELSCQTQKNIYRASFMLPPAY